MSELTSIIQSSLERLESHGHRTSGFVEAYSEPHRVYHNLGHIHDLLVSVVEMTNRFEFSKSTRDNLELAVWYHDFVYEIGSTSNEADSAEIALNRTINTFISHAVQTTATHDQPLTFWGACLLDADLRGLGSSPSEYLENRDRVRAEYGPNLPEESWVRGRSAFLTTYLEKPTLFHTAWGARYEQQARINMSKELFDLKEML